MQADMPELPEVERATELIRSVGRGKRIAKVETVDDKLVFSGVTHEDFARELAGRTLKDARRYGKYFYILLSGEGKHPVLHFGMTGMIQVKGQLPTHYKETPKWASSTDWPPRFYKFILHLAEKDGSVLQLAFMDVRRLGRIRLCLDPLNEPPISALGFDPILSMPSLDDFTRMVFKRTCPVKALLLDQSFSAGVGNWVADEILYHSRIHPEQRCNTLSEEQLQALHHQTSEVCRIAVSVNADDTKFPESWLFKHRWGKGKKEKHTLKLPSGKPATIKWVTVAGRTSALVVELQSVSKDTAAKLVRPVRSLASHQSDLTALSESEAEQKREVRRRKRKVPRKADAKETKQVTESEDAPATKTKRQRK